MYEAIPVAAGIILAFFTVGIQDTRLRNIIIAVVSVVVGVAVSTAVGEGPIFYLFDIAQVALASVVGIMILRRVRASAK